MTVLLVLATFIVLITLDYLFGLGRVNVTEAGVRAVPTAPPTTGPTLPLWPAVEPSWVAGYRLPAGFSYHIGHTWARPIGADTVVVGIDDFAGKLIGTPDEIALPAAGSRVRQGAETFRVRLGERDADLVSPVDGEIIEVNPALQRDPKLLTDDPYGRGWVLKVRSPELSRDLRNTVSGTLAHRWTEHSSEVLQHELMTLSGSVLSDGGEPVADFARHLEAKDWKRLVSEFLLT